MHFFTHLAFSIWGWLQILGLLQPMVIWGSPPTTREPPVELPQTLSLQGTQICPACHEEGLEMYGNVTFHQWEWEAKPIREALAVHILNKKRERSRKSNWHLQRKLLLLRKLLSTDINWVPSLKLKKRPWKMVLGRRQAVPFGARLRDV